jgi:hypothetical protein
MALSYLYGRMQAISSDLLASKIAGNLGLAPTRVQVVGTYGYIEFPAALSANDLATLNQYMLDAWGGTNIATDNSPSVSVFCFGRSPDLTVWKVVIDNAGVLSQASVV